MRQITEIIVHCTASPEGQPMTVKQIDEIHRNANHWSQIGYHKVIYLDGSIHDRRNIEIMGAHCNENGLLKSVPHHPALLSKEDDRCHPLQTDSSASASTYWLYQWSSYSLFMLPQGYHSIESYSMDF